MLLLKKPLCIDSSVVNKIDRVTSVSNISKTESAYSCQVYRLVDYSSDLDAQIQRISPVIERTTLLLESIRPFQNKLQISIREDRPLMFEVVKNKINIGSQFLNLDYHLSRALIKAWIYENQAPLKMDTRLLEESITDFLLYTLNGKIEIEDPVDRTRTKLGSVKWPQVIKASKGYCLSAWKYAEHVENCKENFPEDDRLQDSLAVAYSLRPLLTSSLIGSYNEMGMKQKAKVIKEISRLLSSTHLPSEKIIESMLVESNPLRNGMININKFSDLIRSAALNQEDEIYQLYTGLNFQLQQYGVIDTFSEAYFDYLVEYNGQVDPNSSFYKILDAAAAKNSRVQVALKDNNNIWILPSKTALSLSVFSQIQSRQTVLLSCDTQKMVSIERFFKKTEKLMLINECNQRIAYDFDSLFHDGVKSFITQNHKFNFIQLHMPSLEMVHNKLPASQNFFELVKNYDINRKEFKTLGWNSIEWKKDMQAYRPEAVIDAIEYFRN